MNQKQYISALKKALKGIDSKSRDSILLEIEGLISELDIHESIEERFGSPSKLAKQYLEGEELSPTVGKKVMGIGKKVFLAIGIGITLLILGLVLSAWYFSKDSFNYADTTAKQLDTKSISWNSVEWNSSIKIDLDQGRAILYWHDKPSIDWDCKGKQGIEPMANKAIRIRHNECLIFLPKQALEINVEQSEVVMIKPQVTTKLVLNQAKLRIAEKGERYKYEINATRSQVGDFVSHDDAEVIINILSEESSVKAYEY